MMSRMEVLLSGWQMTPALDLRVVGLLLLMLAEMSSQQHDFSNPISCFTCRGRADNSTCADPVDPRNNPNLVERVCMNGACLKWTKYENGVLLMIRTCSSDLNFHLTMIDGVCRTERNGNGYLCMCGKHLCNSAQPLANSRLIQAISLAACLVVARIVTMVT